ncbi:hypothetical protein ANN_16793 [Periplaneta americana]|uniref:Uncharacterized protein n=1 Tax=Periplaneta americana TaxID=6978 RepID=A0ABQ8SR38_PERAM|nr:hypothetical protein ANN_16793 [Periplaneta americana]
MRIKHCDKEERATRKSRDNFSVAMSSFVHLLGRDNTSIGSYLSPLDVPTYTRQNRQQRHYWFSEMQRLENRSGDPSPNSFTSIRKRDRVTFREPRYVPTCKVVAAISFKASPQYHVTFPDRESNPGHLVSRLDALTVTPQFVFSLIIIIIINVFFFFFYFESSIRPVYYGLIPSRDLLDIRRNDTSGHESIRLRPIPKVERIYVWTSFRFSGSAFCHRYPNRQLYKISTFTMPKAKRSLQDRLNKIVEYFGNEHIRSHVDSIICVPCKT